MDVQANAALIALAAKMRLNALNGNAANGATPGFSVRSNAVVGRSAGAAYGARSAPAAPARQMPPGFARLKLDLPELFDHLANAKELYTAYSVVSKTANQMYGTMLDILDEGGIDDGDLSEEDYGIVAENDVEIQPDAMNEASAEGADSDMEQVGGPSLDASA